MHGVLLTEHDQGLEAALARAQADADAAIRAAGGLIRKLKKARASAATGQVRDLTKALAQAQSNAEELTAQLHRAN